MIYKYSIEGKEEGSGGYEKKNVINLIKYYAENNDSGFRSEAYEIAKDFDQIGDYQLAEYIMALMSNANTFVPQMNENESSMFEKVEKMEILYGCQRILCKMCLNCTCSGS